MTLEVTRTDLGAGFSLNIIDGSGREIVVENDPETMSLLAGNVINPALPDKYFANYAAIAAATAADVRNAVRLIAADTWAIWKRVSSEPSHSCKIQIGGYWYELNTQNGTLVPEMLGYAAGSGVDGTSIYTALQTHPYCSRIKFGQGTYIAKNFRPRANIVIQGDGPLVSIIAGDGTTTINTSTNSSFYINNNNVMVCDLGFEGTPYTKIGTNVGPTAAIYATRPTGAPTRTGIKNLQIRNVRVSGGYSGIIVGGVETYRLTNFIVEWTQGHGVALTSAAISGYIGQGLVQYTAEEGLKRGDDEDKLTRNITMSDIDVIGCGSTNPSLMNDSFDNFLRNGENCRISNVHVKYAAGGGMGFKWAYDADVPVDDFSGQMMMEVQGSVHCVLPIRGFSDQITTPLPVSYDRVNRFNVDVNVNYDYVTHECTVTSIATAANSWEVTFTTSTPHDLSPGDTVWPKVWDTLTLGGLSATEFLRLATVYTVPTSTTFTVVMRAMATSSQTDTAGCSLWCWNRKPLALANNAITLTDGSTTVIFNMPRHGLVAGNEVVIDGATAFANYTTDDLNGRYTVSSVAGDDVSLYGPVTAATGGPATLAGGGSGMTIRRIKKASGARAFFVQGISNVSIRGTVRDANDALSLNPTAHANVYANAINDLSFDIMASGCTNNLQAVRGVIKRLKGRMIGEATQNAILVLNSVTEIREAEFTGVTFKTNSKRRQTAAAQILSMFDTVFKSCRFVAPNGYALRNATESTGAASSGLKFIDCTFEGTQFDPIRHDSGTADMIGCSTVAPTTRRSNVVNAGTLNIDRMHRGFSSGAPTGAGSVGDFYGVTAVSGGSSGYICTTAHATAATWKSVSTIA